MFRYKIGYFFFYLISNGNQNIKCTTKRHKMYCDFIKYINGKFYFCRNEDYETEDNYSLIYWLSR